MDVVNCELTISFGDGRSGGGNFALIYTGTARTRVRKSIAFDG